MLESLEGYGRVEERSRPTSKAKRGRPSDMWMSVLAGLVIVVVYVLVKFGSLDSEWLFAVFPFWGISWYLRKRYERWNESLTVEEALANDPRPPILYLRPFRADKVRFSTWRQRILIALSQISLVAGPLWRILFDKVGKKDARLKTAEEFLVSLLDELGPVIAIGRPKESMPPLGAARIYAGDGWKDIVGDFLKRSQMILMFAGTTTHFGWELERVFQSEPFVPTILILPFFRRYRQSEVNQFLGLFEAATGLHLPEDLRRTRAAFFPKASEMIELKDCDTPDERVLNGLNPFLWPIAQIMEVNHKGWTNTYLEIARSNRRRNWLWALGGAAFILIYTLGSVYWFHRKVTESNVAEQFWSDLFQGTNPCTDAKLAKYIPDTQACTSATLDDLNRSSNPCSDPRLSEIFPDSGSCRDGASWAYARYDPEGKK